MDKHINILTQLLIYRYKTHGLIEWGILDENDKQLRIKIYIYNHLNGIKSGKTLEYIKTIT